jgi:hypothetical protein
VGESSAKSLFQRCVLCLALFACGGKSPGSVPAASVDSPDPSSCASESGEGEGDSDELCALLCQVPGGVEECPAGTPCRSRAPSAIDPQTAIDDNLCLRKDTAAKSCPSKH